MGAVQFLQTGVLMIWYGTTPGVKQLVWSKSLSNQNLAHYIMAEFYPPASKIKGCTHLIKSLSEKHFLSAQIICSEINK